MRHWMVREAKEAQSLRTKGEAFVSQTLAFVPTNLTTPQKAQLNKEGQRTKPQLKGFLYWSRINKYKPLLPVLNNGRRRAAARS